MCIMRFEPAIDSDKEYFRILNRACYEDVVSRQLGSWDEVHQNNNFEKKWPTQNFRKIFVDEQLVGGVWIDEGPDFIQLREVQIHPDFQNQGIGSRVVQMEIDNVRSKGMKLRLRVLFESYAVALYERLGFKIIDFVPSAVRRLARCYSQALLQTHELN